MEAADFSGKKLCRPSWIRVIITLLVGSKIIISCIFGVLEKLHHGEIWMMEIKKQLCLNTSKESDGCVMCPDGWLRHREKCYYFSSGKEYRTWNESREACKEIGAHLLVIENREQQEFIRRSSKGPSYQMFWIGLHRDGDGDGDGWRWVDGRLYNTGLFTLSGSSGDCVWLEAISGYNKDRCQTQHNWICQKRSLKI